MFGHQFHSFSTLSLSGQFLILILLSFDPTQMWVQVDCPNHIFIGFTYSAVGITCKRTLMVLGKG
jgi:hypothetical protein